MRPMPIEPRGGVVQVGARLRAIRQAQDFTMEQIAAATGLTKGFISRVERDQTSPSVGNLLVLCDVLNITMGQLFAEPEVVHVPRASAPMIDLGGSDVHEWLLSPRRDNRFQVVRSVVPPGVSGGGGNELYSLSSEIDFVHVVAGSVRMRFGTANWTLETGDSLTMNGREPHSWEAIGHEGCELIWVLAPALWSSTTPPTSPAVVEPRAGTD